MPEAEFFDARKAFHAALLEATLTTNAAGLTLIHPTGARLERVFS